MDGWELALAQIDVEVKVIGNECERIVRAWTRLEREAMSMAGGQGQCTVEKATEASEGGLHKPRNARKLAVRQHDGAFCGLFVRMAGDEDRSETDGPINRVWLGQGERARNSVRHVGRDRAWSPRRPDRMVPRLQVMRP